MVALVAVLMIGPKWMRRQARLEQKLEGRVRAQQPLDVPPDEFELGQRSGGENNLITVAPLAAFLCVAVDRYSRSKNLRDRNLGYDEEAVAKRGAPRLAPSHNCGDGPHEKTTTPARSCP